MRVDLLIGTAKSQARVITTSRGRNRRHVGGSAAPDATPRRPQPLGALSLSPCRYKAFGTMCDLPFVVLDS
jgi:hypothetical protein